MVPALFGIQQLLEGGIWLSLHGQLPVDSCISGAALTQAFTWFSQVFWPLFIPLAVGIMEPVARRRWAIAVMGMAGLTVAMLLLSFMQSSPVTAHIAGPHITYDFSHRYVWAATFLYLAGTCVSPLLSSYRSVRLFGLVALASAVLTYAVFETWFISVWCYFAGLMSCIMLLHFYPEARHRVERAWTKRWA